MSTKKVRRLSRKLIALTLAICLLAPTMGTAQPTQGASQVPTPPARTPGAFAPVAPGRGDMYLGQQSRSIAGPDYRLGPGDMLDIQIVGRLDAARIQVVVDPDTYIAVPPLGTIKLAGPPL